MLELAPRTSGAHAKFTAPQTIKTAKPRRGRVALLLGCAQKVLRPEIDDSTVRFLNYLGYDVVLSERRGLLRGAAAAHGRRGRGQGDGPAEYRRLASAARAWAVRRHRRQRLGLRHHGKGLRPLVRDDSGHDGNYAAKAKYVSALAKDIAEFAAEQGIDTPLGWSDIRVAYHSACSMQHGQRINEQPRQLLRNAGFTVLEIPEGHICCGSAGTYNILQPEIAAGLKQRKLANIEMVKPDCVASGNIGCITQLSGGKLPVVHTVELLDWAYGGPCPEPLKHLQERVRHLPREGESQETADAAA